MTTPVSEQLNKAADYIEEHGWIAGEGWVGDNPSGKVCLEGAIQAAVGLKSVRRRGGPGPTRDINLCPAGLAFRSYLGAELDIEDPLYRWNDGQYRTAEDVVSALRAAAHIESLKESLTHA